MSRIFHPLLYEILVSATRQELARLVNYLKTENQILRSKLGNGARRSASLLARLAVADTPAMAVGHTIRISADYRHEPNASQVIAIKTLTDHQLPG